MATSIKHDTKIFPKQQLQTFEHFKQTVQLVRILNLYMNTLNDRTHSSHIENE